MSSYERACRDFASVNVTKQIEKEIQQMKRTGKMKIGTRHRDTVPVRALATVNNERLERFKKLKDKKLTIQRITKKMPSNAKRVFLRYLSGRKKTLKKKIKSKKIRK